MRGREVKYPFTWITLQSCLPASDCHLSSLMFFISPAPSFALPWEGGGEYTKALKIIKVFLYFRKLLCMHVHRLAIVILLFFAMPSAVSSPERKEKWCTSVQVSRHNFLRALLVIHFVEDTRKWIKMDFCCIEKPVHMLPSGQCAILCMPPNPCLLFFLEGKGRLETLPVTRTWCSWAQWYPWGLVKSWLWQGFQRVAVLVCIRRDSSRVAA